VRDDRHFGGTHSLQLQGRKVSQPINQEDRRHEVLDKDGGDMFHFHWATRSNILEEGTLHNPNVFILMNSIFLPYNQWKTLYFTAPLYMKKHRVCITIIESGTK
jgi:hypothetical protein